MKTASALLLCLFLIVDVSLGASPKAIVARQRINRVRVIKGKMTREQAAEITQNQIDERRLRFELDEEGYEAAKKRNEAYLTAHRHRLLMQERYVVLVIQQNPLRKPQNENNINISLPKESKDTE